MQNRNARLAAAAGLGMMAAATFGGGARAQAVACPTRPLRWQEDCSGLADKELTGLDQLRYMPIAADGGAWVTMGGEARVRMDWLSEGDFGVGGGEGYNQVGSRALLHADLRTKPGFRVFTQLSVTESEGRKPNTRTQDESQIDLAQAFFDLPVQAGEVRAVMRYGRQEFELSGNRLVNARDGATLRRAFEAVKVDVFYKGYRLAMLNGHPMTLGSDAFDDRVDRTEDFTAFSLDLPADMLPGGNVNLFVLDRYRNDARFLRATGDDRRQTFGARYAGKLGAWTVDMQASGQVGHTQGKPVRAYGIGMSFDRPLPGPGRWAVGIDAVAASGDKGDTDTIESFDPVYPNNGGLSDAPSFYQTNYVFAGGGFTKVWKGATWGINSNILARHSTSDAIFTSYFGARPIRATIGDERLSAALSQVSVRRPLTPRSDFYLSFVRLDPLGAIKAAGGTPVFYSRMQVTARF